MYIALQKYNLSTIIWQSFVAGLQWVTWKKNILSSDTLYVLSGILPKTRQTVLRHKISPNGNAIESLLGLAWFGTYYIHTFIMSTPIYLAVDVPCLHSVVQRTVGGIAIKMSHKLLFGKLDNTIDCRVIWSWLWGFFRCAPFDTRLCSTCLTSYL